MRSGDWCGVGGGGGSKVRAAVTISQEKVRGSKILYVNGRLSRNRQRPAYSFCAEATFDCRATGQVQRRERQKGSLFDLPLLTMDWPACLSSALACVRKKGRH